MLLDSGEFAAVIIARQESFMVIRFQFIFSIGTYLIDGIGAGYHEITRGESLSSSVRLVYIVVSFSHVIYLLIVWTGGRDTSEVGIRYLVFTLHSVNDSFFS